MVLTWETPYTSWHGEEALDGSYTGDYFDSTAYNRIINNLQYLADYANSFYYKTVPHVTMEGKAWEQLFYASDINTIEKNLYELNRKTKLSKRAAKTYVDNGLMIDADELNYIESMCVTTEDNLRNQKEHRRTLTFNLGIPGGF